MDLSKYEPKIELADQYEKIEEWFCDECNADQVYVGDGRMMCAELDCENLFGNNDSQEHMTGSYADMNDLNGHQVEERISEFDGRLINILLREQREKMGEEILDNYLGSWSYATKDQLIEELSMVYLEGLTGLRRMSYNELESELANYKENDG
jgi:hypothetical protein|tara:strand:+ start:180 stop:638 length:459 start_codon:yes stop_codon:yes gene_type:complete